MKQSLVRATFTDIQFWIPVAVLIFGVLYWWCWHEYGGH
jgi:hypothetical protein